MNFLIFLTLALFCGLHTPKAYTQNLLNVQKETSQNQDIEKIKSELEIIKKTAHENGKLNDTYLRMLESANNQLSSSYNHYGLSVGILSILFAALAIFAAVMMFNMSAERKRELADEINNRNKDYKKFLDDQIYLINSQQEQASATLKELHSKMETSLNTYIQQTKTDFDRLIEEQVTKLEHSNNEDRQKIENQIIALKKEKAQLAPTVYSEIANQTTKSFSKAANSGTIIGICESCKGTYPRLRMQNGTLNLNRTCSCGHINKRRRHNTD